VQLNFLNYIAVPITIGIGVDYPFNVMARLRQDMAAGLPLRSGLIQTGGAVILCSLTTLIGYAVLLLSDTGAIRSFGMAAVLGEITSALAAVVIVPSLLLVWRRRD
jgi:predicted RND superfamily exporter protein